MVTLFLRGTGPNNNREEPIRCGCRVVAVCRTYLDEVQVAEFGLGAKLPLALCVCVVELPGQLLWVLVLAHLPGLVHQAGRLGSPDGENTHTHTHTQTSL